MELFFDEFSLDAFPSLRLQGTACLHCSVIGSRFRELVAGFGHIFDVQLLLVNVTPNSAV
jgi:hypothetical protein